MDPDQTVTDVEAVSAELARVTDELARVAQQFDRVLGQLGTAELQLDDTRRERNHEHERAEALQAERNQEHERAEAFKLERDQRDQLVAALRTAQKHNEAINLAIGTIAGKAGLDYPAARSRLESFSRGHRQEILDVAGRLTAVHAQAAPLGAGDPEVARILAEASIPLDFWNALTLDGAIFE